MSEPAGLRAKLRELPRTLWLLVLDAFVNRFGSFGFVFLVLYVKHLGHSTAAAGLAAVHTARAQSSPEPDDLRAPGGRRRALARSTAP